MNKLLALRAISTFMSLMVVSAHAAVGDVDPTYGGNGVFQIVASASGDCLLNGMLGGFFPQAALMGDGSLVYSATSGGGATTYSRVDANGHPDTGFAPSGGKVLITNFEMCSSGGLTRRPLRTLDGKSWLGGSLIGSGGRQSAILRLDGSGNPDRTFGIGGLVTRPAPVGDANYKIWDGNWTSRLALQPDGRVLAVFSDGGGVEVGMRRYDANGSTDPNFGTADGAVVLPTIEPLDYFYILPAGKIYTDFGYGDYERILNSDGLLESTSFAANSINPNVVYWRLLTPLPGGDSIYAGYDVATKQDLLARLHSDGMPATSFGGSGTGYRRVAAAGSSTALSVDSLAFATVSGDGRYVYLAGSSSNGNAVAKLDSTSGTLDPQFGDHGIVTFGHAFYIEDMVAQTDGSVILLGQRAVSGESSIRLQGSSLPSPGMVAVTTAVANESDGTMTVRVTRIAGNSGALRVSYSTNDNPTVTLPGDGYTSISGSVCSHYLPATAGKDYSAVSGYLDWSDGDTTDKSIVISVVNDNFTNNCRFFEVNLGVVTGSPVILTPKTEAKILDVTNLAGAVVTTTTPTPVARTAGGGGTFDPIALALLLLCLAATRAKANNSTRPPGYG